MHRKHPMWLAIIIGAISLGTLALIIFALPQNTNFPTANSMPKTFNDLVALKTDNGSFELQTTVNDTTVAYEENDTRATKTPVLVVVEKQSYTAEVNQLRLYISPEDDGVTYRLEPSKLYYGRIAEESIPLPPEVEQRNRSVLMISDKPFAENGYPVVDPTPMTMTIR